MGIEQIEVVGIEQIEVVGIEWIEDLCLVVIRLKSYRLGAQKLLSTD